MIITEKQQYASIESGGILIFSGSRSTFRRLVFVRSFGRVEDASASQARCTCYGRDIEIREAHVSEEHNEVRNCCHGDSTVAPGIIATQGYK